MDSITNIQIFIKICRHKFFLDFPNCNRTNQLIKSLIMQENVINFKNNENKN